MNILRVLSFYLRKAVLLFIVLVSLCSALFAQTTTWTGLGAAGNWNDVMNWNNGVPNTGSFIAQFNTPGIITITAGLPGSAISNLNISGGAQVILQQAGGLLSSNQMSIAAGSNLTIGVNQTLRLMPSFTSTASGSGTVNINGTVILDNGHTLNNQNPMAVSVGSTGEIQIVGNATVVMNQISSYAAGAKLTYLGATAKTIGLECPPTIPAGVWVTINNSAGVTLGTARTVQGIWTIKDGRSFTINNTITVNMGGKIQIEGSAVITGTTNFTYASAADTLEFTGTNPYTISAFGREVTGGAMNGTIIVDKPGGVVNSSPGLLRVNGGFQVRNGTWSLGAFAFPTGSRLELNGTNNLINPGASLILQAGTNSSPVGGNVVIETGRTLVNNGTFTPNAWSSVIVKGNGQIIGSDTVRYQSNSVLRYEYGAAVKTTTPQELPPTMQGGLLVLGGAPFLTLGSSTSVFGSVSCGSINVEPLSGGKLATAGFSLVLNNAVNTISSQPSSILGVQPGGTLWINNGATLTLVNNPNSILQIQNGMPIGGTLRLEGTGQVNGANTVGYSAGISPPNLLYTGNGNRTPTTSEIPTLPTTLNVNLHINKTSGTFFDIPTPAGSVLTLSVNSILSVTSGIIRSGRGTNGILRVSRTNFDAVTFANTGFGYVQGELQRDITPAMVNRNAYIYPLGDAGRFLPLSINSSIVVGTTTIAAEAVSNNANGMPVAPLTQVATMEYWRMQRIVGTVNQMQVGIFRSGGFTAPAVVGRLDAIMPNGMYTSIGGTAITNGLTSDITNSPAVSPNSSYFLGGDISLPVKAAFGHQLFFNGSNQTVIAPARAVYDSIASFTVEALVRPYWLAGGPAYDPCILSFGDAASQNFALNMGQLYATLKVSTNSGATSVQRPVMPLFRRYNYAHVAVSYNAGLLTYYVDGKLMGTDNMVLTGVAGKPFYIGSRGGFTEFWQGSIDEVRIWNTPLPQSVVASWRGRELDLSHPNVSNLIGYWRFNEGYSQNTADNSVVANTASLVNAPLWVNASTTASVIVAPSGTASGQLQATKVGAGVLSYSALGVNAGSTMANVAIANGGAISYTPTVNVGQDARDSVTYRVTDNLPSQTNATIVVEFSPNVTVNTQFVGFNKPTRFTAPNIQGGTSPFSQIWTPTTNLTNTNTLQPTATLATNATYSLQIQDGYGFGGTYNVPVQIHPLVLAFSNSSSTATTGLPGLINSGNPFVMRYSVFRRRTGQFDSTDASVALRVDAAMGGNAQFSVNYTRTFTNTASILEPGIVINWLNAPLAGGTTQAIVTLFRTAGAPIDPVQVQITISSNATAPVIASFAPNIGGSGTFVTITGANFVNVNNVRFGNISAQSFSVISPTEIRAQVAAAGNTGLVTVVAMAGSGNSPSTFTFVQPPTITSFTPSQGTSGATVQVRGSNFVSPLTVRFGGVPGTNLDVVSPTELFVDVGAGATGNVSVTTPGGTVTSATVFTFFGVPVITSIAPLQGTAGDTITVQGNNFQLIDSVKIGSQMLTGANGTVLPSASQTQVRIVLGTVPLSGVVTIFAAAGQTSSSQAFTYISPPKIDSLSPRVGGNGTVLTVLGKNFIQIDSVRFGTVRLQSLVVNSTSALTVTMPAGLPNSTNAIIVFARAGRDTSKTPHLFQYVQPPQITAFTSAAGSGAWVQITGANLVNVSSVLFGGVAADSIRNISSVLTLARVGAGASGKISLSAAGGTAQSMQDFRFLRPPTITGFTPSSGATGASIEITGTEFVNVTGVSVGGISVANFSVASDSRIIATLSNKATSGTIRVSTLQGQAASASPFQVLVSLGPPPSIVSFTPPSGEAGTEVFISGQNLNGATQVQFAGITAASFQVISPFVVSAIVPQGATTGAVRIFTPNGIATSVAAFRFIAPSVGGDNFTPLQRDSLILVRLYNATGGGAWLNERNWLGDVPISSWAGVTVENGRVTRLELSNNALLGALPSFVAELQALRVLDVSGNQLSGTVPSSIASITTLEVMRFRRNNFSGAFPALATNASLQVFDIGQNRFVGDIPRGLCNAPNLREIRLDSNGFSGVLPSCLGNLQRVEILDASENLLSDSIPHTLGSMTALRELLLSGNQFSGAIPPTLATQATVSLAAEAGKSSQLQAVPNLQRLDLSRNRLSGLIPSGLGECRSLRTLNLSQNQLTGNLPLSLGNLVALQSLDCSRNRLSGVLPNIWSSLRQLQVLSLRNNAFVGAVPNEIGRLSAVTTMWLDSNAFTSLTDSIQNIAMLQRLSLARNRLTTLPPLRRTSGITMDSVNVAFNALTFESLERNFTGVRSALYSPQDSILSRIDTTVRVFGALRFRAGVGGLFNDYQWYRAGRAIVGATDSILSIERFARADTGVYTCWVRNRLARDLTLIRRAITIQALPPQAPSERPLLITPQNAAQSVSIVPTCVWTTTAFTSSYDVEISTQADFATAATLRFSVNDPFRTRLQITAATALRHLTTHFWRVRSVSEGLVGSWSEVSRFTTLPEGQTVNVESVNFGRVLLRRTVERNLTIQNVSGTRIIIQSVRLVEPATQTRGQFTVSGLSANAALEADSSIALRVRFSAGAVGEQSATVVVGYSVASSGSAAPIEVTFSGVLSGRGGALGVIGSEELDFGTVTSGLSKTESIQLVNISSGAITLLSRTLSASENSNKATFGVNDVIINAILLQPNQSTVLTLNTSVKQSGVRDSVRGTVKFIAQVENIFDTLTIPTFVRIRPQDSNDILLLPRIRAREQQLRPGSIVQIEVRIGEIDTKEIRVRSTQGTVEEQSQFALKTLQRATASAAAFTGDITMNRQVLIPASDENRLAQITSVGDMVTYTFLPTRWTPDANGRLDSSLLQFRCRVVSGSTDSSALRITRFVWDTTRTAQTVETVSQVIVRLDTVSEYFVSGISKAGGKRLIAPIGSKSLVVSPNPSSDNLMLTFTISQKEYLTVEILTLQGTLLKGIVEGQYEEGTHQARYSLDFLPSGTYLVRLKGSRTLLQERFQVIR